MVHFTLKNPNRFIIFVLVLNYSFFSFSQDKIKDLKITQKYGNVDLINDIRWFVDSCYVNSKINQTYAIFAIYLKYSNLKDSSYILSVQPQVSHYSIISYNYSHYFKLDTIYFVIHYGIEAKWDVFEKLNPLELNDCIKWKIHHKLMPPCRGTTGYRKSYLSVRKKNMTTNTFYSYSDLMPLEYEHPEFAKKFKNFKQQKIIRPPAILRVPK